MGRKDNKETERNAIVNKKSKEYLNRVIIIGWLDTKKKEKLKSKSINKTINKECMFFNTFKRGSRLFVSIK